MMLRKLLPALFLFSLVASGVFAADWWINPYGSYSTYFDHSGDYVNIDNFAYSGPSIPDSQAANSLGGGMMIGIDLESYNGILGLNVEYLGGSKDLGLAEEDTLLGPASLSFDAPAFAVGAFYASEVPYLTSSNFRGLFGIEAGFLIASGTMTFKYTEASVDTANIEEFIYEDKEETQDLGGTNLYFSIFIMEEYALTEKFGLSLGLGYRLMSNSPHGVSTRSMSGGYSQEYGGFSARLGIRYDI